MAKAPHSRSTAAHDATEAPPDLSYDAAMLELEALVEQMESGEMPLEDLLTAYQRGAALVQLCRDRLKAVEDQIKVLDEGVLKPWKAQ
jgi:exodeoxyribonuclease VII small subunit